MDEGDWDIPNYPKLFVVGNYYIWGPEMVIPQ